jgi:hypothetical protein
VRTDSRRPLFLVIAITIAVGYAAWTSYSYFQYTNAFYDKYVADAREELYAQVQLGAKLIRHNEIELLKVRLMRDVDNDRIHSYVLKRNGKVIAGIDRSEVIDRLPAGETNRIMHSDDHYSYATTKEGDWQLTVVVFDSKSAFVGRHLGVMLPALKRNIAVVSTICCLIVFFFLKDILQALRVLASNAKKRNFRIRTRSAEGAALVRGLNAMEDSMDTLKSQNEILRNQVLSALKTELASGRTPPYDFECTLIRVDVNNFSYIFNHYPIEEFMGVINRFFEQVTEVVSRYDGYVYEFVGDEVIFYFKDSDHPNSKLTAISALRDILAIAVQLDAEIKPQLGYHFRVKCSAAHGKLRFGPQVNGYSLAGAILIDTVRILALINERESNIVFYPREIHEHVRPLVTSAPQTQAILKGSSHVQDIWSYQGHQPLHEIIEACTPETSEALNFYRSNDHICEVLRFLRANARKIETKLFLAMTTQLRNFKLAHAQKDVTAEYQLLIKELIRRCIGTVSHVDDAFRLSSTVTLATHLLDAYAFETSLKNDFNNCLKMKDRRVVANALKVFSYFESEDSTGAGNELLNHKDNRIAANALVREGVSKGLNKTVLRHLTRMMGSNEVLFQASGLYALGELAAHHRITNPVYFETSAGFHRLFAEVESALLSANEMVRRQALIAARKTADAHLNKAVMNRYETLSDPRLKQEIENHFFEQPQLKVAA